MTVVHRLAGCATVGSVHDDGRAHGGEHAGRLAGVSDDPQRTAAVEPDPTTVADGSPRPADEPVDEPIDLDRIDADLAGVEGALRRLDDGTYWSDEVTGEPIDPDVIERDPTATRNSA